MTIHGLLNYNFSEFENAICPSVIMIALRKKIDM